MWQYFVILLVYILSFPIIFLVSDSLTFTLLIKLILVGGLLLYYKKSFKFKLKFDFLAVFVGLIIFTQWVLLEGVVPYNGEITIYSYSIIDIILKMIISVGIAPIIEEFFTRFFLIRWVIDKKWQKVKLGKYTFSSFIFTVLFFGFSHLRWLPGLITGILLNLLYYKRKNIESCVLAHAVANLALGIYIIYTGSYQFW